MQCFDPVGTTSVLCDPKLRPVATQPCSTGINCSNPTEENVQVETSEAPTPHHEEYSEEDEEESEEDDGMSRDDPRSYRYERSKDSNLPYKHELPKPERLVDQRVPNEPT